MFIWAFSTFYIGIYLLYSAEPLCLFEPRHSYEPCFYSDKYGTCTHRLCILVYVYFSYVTHYIATYNYYMCIITLTWRQQLQHDICLSKIAMCKYKWMVTEIKSETKWIIEQTNRYNNNSLFK